MKSLKTLLILTPLFTAMWGCSERSAKEMRQESNLARRVGHTQALELNEVLKRDTLAAEMMVLDVRARETELRRRGAPDVADTYINEFLHTLDSVNPSLRAQLQ